MPSRELIRRIAIWAGVAVYLASVIADIAVNGYAGATGLIAFTGFPVVGAIILTSRPRNGVGWFLYAYGLGWILGSYGLLKLFTAPDGSIEPIAAALFTGYGYLYWPTVPLVGALFPTGRFETRLGRVAGWSLLAVNLVFAVLNVFAPEVFGLGDDAIRNPIGVPVSPEFVTIATIAYAAIAIPAIVAIAVDVVLRWRRSVGVERQQFKWFGFGLLATLVLYVGVGMGIMLPLQSATQPGVYDVIAAVMLSTIEFIPISIGIAVTRHGLYDIGRVVSRTVSYALVALVVVGIYVGIVLAASLFMPAGNPILVAVATLVAAAVFLPLLRWVQRLLDRRFDRERYDAERVVEAFGARLQNEVDPQTTVPELVLAVEQTLRPAAVGVWTR